MKEQAEIPDNSITVTIGKSSYSSKQFEEQTIICRLDRVVDGEVFFIEDPNGTYTFKCKGVQDESIEQP